MFISTSVQFLTGKKCTLFCIHSTYANRSTIAAPQYYRGADPPRQRSTTATFSTSLLKPSHLLKALHLKNQIQLTISAPRHSQPPLPAGEIIRKRKTKNKERIGVKTFLKRNKKTTKQRNNPTIKTCYSLIAEPPKKGKISTVCFIDSLFYRQSVLSTVCFPGFFHNRKLISSVFSFCEYLRHSIEPK